VFLVCYLTVDDAIRAIRHTYLEIRYVGETNACRRLIRFSFPGRGGTSAEEEWRLAPERPSTHSSGDR
jgi:hypothetical protein